MKVCACGQTAWGRYLRCNGCRKKARPPCGCGQPKEKTAKTCWACYMALQRRYADLRTSTEAAAALDTYWQEVA